LRGSAQPDRPAPRSAQRATEQHQDLPVPSAGRLRGKSQSTPVTTRPDPTQSADPLVMIKTPRRSHAQKQLSSYPAGMVDDVDLQEVGILVRTETKHIVVGYEFDMQINKLTPRLAANPTAGREHTFIAYRISGTGSGTITMRGREEILQTLAQDVAE